MRTGNNESRVAVLNNETVCLSSNVPIQHNCCNFDMPVLHADCDEHDGDFNMLSKTSQTLLSKERFVRRRSLNSPRWVGLFHTVETEASQSRVGPMGKLGFPDSFNIGLK